MAIDTQAKRMSISGYCCFPMGAYPTGTITAPERAAIGWLYAGITYAPPLVVSTNQLWLGVRVSIGLVLGALLPHYRREAFA